MREEKRRAISRREKKGERRKSEKEGEKGKSEKKKRVKKGEKRKGKLLLQNKYAPRNQMHETGQEIVSFSF